MPCVCWWCNRVGCKVMNPDGSPARRDPVFLQETGIGYVRPPTGAAHSQGVASMTGLTHNSLDPAVPITMYTEAAAKAMYNGTFYVSAAGY